MIGILQSLRIKILSASEKHEPEIYDTPKSQPTRSLTKLERNEQLLTEQNNKTAGTTKANNLIKKEEPANNNKSKSFYLFGVNDFKNCQHKFGFLGKSFDNKPIPNECFGCSKIIECFNQTKKPKKKEKPTLSTTLYW